MSNYNPQGGGLQYRGTAAQSPPNCWFNSRDPGQFDTQGFSLLDMWLNTVNDRIFILVNLEGSSAARRSLAIWSQISGTTDSILTITGNSGGSVTSDASSNINIIGTAPIIVTGTPLTFTQTITIAPATTSSQGSALYSNDADTISGTNLATAVTPDSLSAKLGTQTLNGVGYGGGGIGTTLLWTAQGATGTVLIGTSAAPAFSTNPVVTQVTINGTVTNPTDAATKAYVDSFVSGFSFQPSGKVATTANLTVTYANGAAGVGATLTNNGAQVALSIDGVALIVNDRVLVKDQTTQFQNGIYTVTDIGSGATNWIMTRATDYDQAPAEIKPGNIVPISQGTVNSNSLWLQTATVTTIGTDAIVFVPFGTNPVVPLPIAEGGTNTTSFTETNGVVYFDGTKLESIDPGTTGQFLLSTGAGSPPSFQTVSPGGGGVISTIYNTPGAFTWTADASTKMVEIFGWGGGGRGTANVVNGGPGGGTMYYKIPIFFLNSPVSGVVGSGASGASVSGTPSSFGNFSTGPAVSGTAGGGYVRSSTENWSFSFSLVSIANSAPNANTILPPLNFGSMSPSGGGGSNGTPGSNGGAGASIVRADTGAVIIAGGVGGTFGISPTGGNGADGYVAGINFLSGGAGGGAGAYGSNGGNGGFPGGGAGGGGGGGGLQGNGGDGLILVFEYT